MPKPKIINPDKQILSRDDFRQQHLGSVNELELKKLKFLDTEAAVIGHKYRFTRHVITRLFNELKRYGDRILAVGEDLSVSQIICSLRQNTSLRASVEPRNGDVQYRPRLYLRFAGRVELAIYLILVAEGYTFGNELEQLVRGKGDFLTAERRQFIKAHLKICRKQGLRGLALEQYILEHVFKDLINDEISRENKREEKIQKKSASAGAAQGPIDVVAAAPQHAESAPVESQESRDNVRKTLNLFKFHIKYYMLDLQYTQLLTKYIENYIEELLAINPHLPESKRVEEVNRLKVLAHTAINSESTREDNWEALNTELRRIAGTIRKDYHDNMLKMRHRSFLYFIDTEIDHFIDHHFNKFIGKPLNNRDHKREELKGIVKAKMRTTDVSEQMWPQMSIQLKYLISSYKCDGATYEENTQRYNGLLMDIRNFKLNPHAELSMLERQFAAELQRDQGCKPKQFGFTPPTDLVNYGKSLELANQNYDNVVREINWLKQDRYNPNLSLTEKTDRMRTRCDNQMKFVGFLLKGIQGLDVAVNERRTNTVFYWPFTPPKVMEEVQQATRAALEAALDNYVKNPGQLPDETLERTVTYNCLRLKNLKGKDWWTGLFGPTRQLWLELDRMSREINVLQNEWIAAQSKEVSLHESQSFIHMRHAQSYYRSSSP